MQQLNNYKSLWKNCAYIFQITKNYQFYCSVFQLDANIVLKYEDKS